MASVVTICNMALTHIGSEARVSSISPPDGSIEAGYCATFFPHARAELIELGTWPFAQKRATLAEVTNESATWLYAYALPSDCLRALRVVDAAALRDDLGIDFRVEGRTLFTDQEDAVLLYERDVTDTGTFSASFTVALSFLLAAYLAGPVIKGTEGTRIGDAMRQRAEQMASTSATASANASQDTASHLPDSIAARV